MPLQDEIHTNASDLSFQPRCLIIIQAVLSAVVNVSSRVLAELSCFGLFGHPISCLDATSAIDAATAEAGILLLALTLMSWGLH